MTREQRIEKLKDAAKAKLKKLGDLIAEGAADHDKGAIADDFNRLQRQIDALGNPNA